MPTPVPAYFDFLIHAFERGFNMSRSVHLGHWDDRPSTVELARPGEFQRAQERLDENLLAMADLNDNQSIVDVGCGFGGSLERVNARYNGLQMAGVNIDPRQLAICRQLQPRAGNQMQWVEADACALPYPDGAIDRVLCIEAMFHFGSRSAFFHEAARVLRPGGILVISDLYLLNSPPDGANLPRFGFEAILRDGYGPWPEPWLEDDDNTGHRNLAAAAGLQCTQYRDATAATAPSHHFTVPPELDGRRDPGSPTLRAALMLKWLHENGHLRCVYMRFDKLRR